MPSLGLQLQAVGSSFTLSCSSPYQALQASCCPQHYHHSSHYCSHSYSCSHHHSRRHHWKRPGLQAWGPYHCLVWRRKCSVSSKRGKVQLIKIDQQQQQRSGVFDAGEHGALTSSLPSHSGSILCSPFTSWLSGHLALRGPQASLSCPPASWVPSLAPFVLTPASDPIYSPTSPALEGRWRRLWGPVKRIQIEVLSSGR